MTTVRPRPRLRAEAALSLLLFELLLLLSSLSSLSSLPARPVKMVLPEDVWLAVAEAVGEAEDSVALTRLGSVAPHGWSSRHELAHALLPLPQSATHCWPQAVQTW